MSLKISILDHLGSLTMCLGSMSWYFSGGIAWWIIIWWYFSAFVILSILTRSQKPLAKMQTTNHDSALFYMFYRWLSHSSVNRLAESLQPHIYLYAYLPQGINQFPKLKTKHLEKDMPALSHKRLFIVFSFSTYQWWLSHSYKALPIGEKANLFCFIVFSPSLLFWINQDCCFW